MPATNLPTLPFYTQPATMTSAGRHTAALRALLHPSSVAVVGASRERGSAGAGNGPMYANTMPPSSCTG